MRSTEKFLLWLVVLGGVTLAVGLFVYLKPGAGDSVKEAETAAGPVGSAEIIGDVPLAGEEEALTGQARVAMAPETVEEASRKPGVQAGARGGITGRVITEFGDPLPGVKIEARADALDAVFEAMDIQDRRKVDLKGESCTSDRDGRFRIDEARGKPAPQLRLHHAEYVTRYFKLGEGQQDVGDLVMELGGGVSGYVLEASGVGIEGAEVYAHVAPKDRKGPSFIALTFGANVDDRKAETGADGFYRITGVPEGRADVIALHPEYTSSTLEDVKIVKGREKARADLTLAAGHTIAGRVVDDQDRPVEGAQVMTDRSLHISLEDFDGFMPSLRNAPGVQTDGDGVFLLSGLEEGEYTVRVMASSFLPFKKDRVKTGVTNLVAVLNKGGWAAGHIRDARDGRLIKEFDVQVNSGGFRPTIPKAITGDEALKKHPALGEGAGAFYIEGLAQGSFGLLVTAEGYADEERKELMAAPGEGVVIDIEMWKESTISGLLLTADGDPVTEGTVFLRKPVARGGQGMRREIRLEASGDSLEVDPEAGASRKSVQSTEDGRFIFRGVKEGEYELTAAHKDHTDALPLPVSVDRGDHVENLMLNLGASGIIEGTVYDVDGGVKPGAKVRAKERGGNDFMGKMAATDGEGVYRFKGLSPAEYQVMLVDSGAGPMGGMVFMTMGSEEETPPGAYNVQVKEGEITKLDLYEMAKASVTGRVTELGEPVEGFTVKLFKQGRFAFMPVKTGQTLEDGTYLMNDVTPGDYTVRLDLIGLPEPMEEDVSLGAGSRATRDFALPSGRIEGTITDQNTGEPVVGANVSLEVFHDQEEETGGGEQTSVRFQFAAVTSSADSSGGYNTLTITGGGAENVKTDRDGRYRIRFVKDGEYRVVASGGGYSRGSLAPVKVNEGSATKNKDFKLERGYTLSGVIVDAATGKPVPFCQYSLSQHEEDGNSNANATLSNGDGTFTMEDLEPGKYTLDALGEDYTGTRTVVIKDEDLKEIEFEVHAK